MIKSPVAMSFVVLACLAVQLRAADSPFAEDAQLKIEGRVAQLVSTDRSHGDLRRIQQVHRDDRQRL